ncbi:MAG: hypothetical protein RL709_324 [Pseudomonadota bacterium]|jgi:hypothetical protein
MNNTYTDKIEECLHDLIRVVLDPSLLKFLTEKERAKVSQILENIPAKI